jgi:bifunctional DNA-binding transcriptional regulator/antitoxin component of YhaV-PrlF toxin-antitoxin module
VNITKPGIEKKVVDEQGRIVLPADWRNTELTESKEVFIIKKKGYLKIISKKKIDLTKFFDELDFGVNIESWDQFEEEINKK